MTRFTIHPRWRWLIFILIAVITLIIYTLTSLNAGQGNLLMPLDDVYIHFQYARQMAIGHPYQYNLIDPPTSGATSLLYPYLLTIGYLVGFQGLWLGLWAMILGTISLIISQWTVYRLCDVLEVPQWLSLITAMTFGISGTIAWHFMSGMETGIAITLTLLTLLFVIEKRLIPFLIVSILLTITRPEGGLVATVASGTLFLRLWHDYGAQAKQPARRKYLLLLALPILAMCLQPLVNWLITGTTVATGAQAKSILATVPQDMTLIITRIWDNFSRMWLEFITGYDAREGRGWYLPLATGAIGLLAIPMLLTKKNYRLIGLMLLGWLFVSTGAISTLDNAFWHFKRYQMPMLTLFFPLSAWILTALLNRVQPAKIPVYIYSGLILPVFAILLAVQFQHYHAMNVSYVYQQPFQMATWLRENTPDYAIVAVHDVGLMRYWGERSTLDMVGLTTPNAAAYWRNGPGSVAEFLINQQPDYIASYGRGHGYGLAFLEDTSLYENQLAEFFIEDWQPHLNVALAADKQGIYQPQWSSVNFRSENVSEHLAFSIGAKIQQIDVANLESELQANYQWSSIEDSGFTTETREMSFRYTGYRQDSLTDAYRLIDEYERFTVSGIILDYNLMLVTRVHASSAGELEIYLNGEYYQTRVVTNDSGHWLDIPTLVPSEYLSETMHIEIRPVLEPNTFYMPAQHTIRQGVFDIPVYYDEYLASFQSGNLRLVNAPFAVTDFADLVVPLVWEPVGGEGDYRLFVHLYDDVNQPPVAQKDTYLRGNDPFMNTEGSQPVGNLLPLYFLDTFILPIDDLPAGTYQLAIGFYNPNDPTDRLIPESDFYEVTDDGRLWLGEVEID
ncbi:MAG: hypothetical protein AAFV93_06205 [Chloroflexota bacterium]